MRRPHRDLISTAQLSALVAVADSGSLGAAALELGLAQSTVSGLIQSLERLLGGVLVLRGRRGARLTPLGERVCAHARTALGALERLRGELEGELDGEAALRGTLRVIACRSAARHLVLPSLALLRTRHPELRVLLADTQGEHDEVVEAVSAGRADIGFGRLPEGAGLHSRPLVADEFLVVRPRGAPAPTGWAELGRPPLLANQDCAPYIAAHAARHGLRWQATRDLRDPQVMLDLVRGGAGLTVLSGLVLHPLPDDLQVSSLPTPLWRTLGWTALPARLSARPVAAYTALLAEAAVLREVTRATAHLLRYAP